LEELHDRMQLVQFSEEDANDILNGKKSFRSVTARLDALQDGRRVRIFNGTRDQLKTGVILRPAELQFDRKRINIIRKETVRERIVRINGYRQVRSRIFSPPYILEQNATISYTINDDNTYNITLDKGKTIQNIPANAIRTKDKILTVRWSDGKYYPAMIDKINADDTYNVKFYDGDKKDNVPYTDIKLKEDDKHTPDDERHCIGQEYVIRLDDGKTVTIPYNQLWNLHKDV